MTDTSSISSHSAIVAYVVVYFGVVLICSFGSFVVYCAFVRRFGFSGWCALPIAVTSGIPVLWTLKIWPLSDYTWVFEYVDSEQMYFTIWGIGVAYLSYFYNGYKSQSGPFIGMTDLLMFVLSMPIIGLALTGLWLFMTGDNRLVQRESRHSISNSLRLFHFARLIAIPIIVWVAF